MNISGTVKFALKAKKATHNLHIRNVTTNCDFFNQPLVCDINEEFISFRPSTLDDIKTINFTKITKKTYLTTIAGDIIPIGEFNIDEEKWTLAVGIFEFITNQSEINYSAFAAAAIIVAFPITILYITFQRYLIEGITAGANKG